MRGTLGVWNPVATMMQRLKILDISTLFDILLQESSVTVLYGYPKPKPNDKHCSVPPEI